jgi:hypothetical protein
VRALAATAPTPPDAADEDAADEDAADAPLGRRNRRGPAGRRPPRGILPWRRALFAVLHADLVLLAALVV